MLLSDDISTTIVNSFVTVEVKGDNEIPAPAVEGEENTYELVDIRRDGTAQAVKQTSKKSSWSTPLVVIAVLLCLIVLLLVVILSLLLVQLSATSTSTATTGAIAGNNGCPNFTQWANDIVNEVNQSLPDFNKWADSIVSKVNSCNMEESPCGSGGGWTRLAYLDMTDATVNCPPGFRLYQSRGVRACGRPVTNSGSCVSVQFPSNGISYSQICGRVTGYQYGSPDALHNEDNGHRNKINSSYIDGVSITRGSSRQHVWTLIAGYSETSSLSATNRCPCNIDNTISVPFFIGTNYFCESGSRNTHWSSTLYTSDPLWDGQGCGSNETACCNVPGIPWFHRDYGSNTTTDYIELRVCGDEETDNEDVPVGYYEIYVK